MPPELQKILDKFPITHRAAGEPVLYQGEVPRHAYVLTEGIVKVYDIGASGDEKIINFFSRGDILPPSWFLDRAPVSLFYYDAFTDCSLYRIPREILAEAIEQNPAITHFFYKHYSQAFISSMLEINALEQPKGGNKIVHILQYLLMRFPGEKKQEWQLIDLRITHQDIANMTGLTRETTSTELNKLRKKGILQYGNQHYSLNIPLLRSELSSEEFLNFTYDKTI